MTAREELINDLIAFADLLERRPDMPVDDYVTVRVQYSVLRSFGDEAARIAEVERVAAILDVDPDRSDPRSVAATLELGKFDRVTYTVHTATDYGDAVYDAERSYRGVVQPESVGAR